MSFIPPPYFAAVILHGRYSSNTTAYTVSNPSGLLQCMCRECLCSKVKYMLHILSDSLHRQPPIGKSSNTKRYVIHQQILYQDFSKSTLFDRAKAMKG